MALFEVKLRPTGPWRVGPRTGERERVDGIYHSDALYSAITHAAFALGWMPDWLAATAETADVPAVRFSSLFPFVGKTRLIPPPRSVWPPATARLHVRGAKLVPIDVAFGAFDETKYVVDGPSECMIPAGGIAPFQISSRSAAAVDRVTGAAEPHRTACLEFASNAGWWGLVDITGSAREIWEPRLRSAFRLLADSGFGGERSQGWGRAAEPEWRTALPHFRTGGEAPEWWLLSLFSPHPDDAVDWTKGEYGATVRGGWTESPAGSARKKQVRMIEEGSVLSAASLRGQAVDVRPEGFPHPVYRAGFALAIPVPARVAVETLAAETVVPEPVAAEPVVPEPVVPEPVIPEPVTAEPTPEPPPPADAPGSEDREPTPQPEETEQ